MKKINTTTTILLSLLLLFTLIKSSHQQQAVDDSSTAADDPNDDDDDCAFISGQHCDQNGICKYCAMCLQSSCILSKTINSSNSSLLQQPQSSCNTTQFGTTNLYNWYDYCLSSDNDSTGSYCATSTECYQYRKSAGPSVTYAWHNLTCNPNTCILTASNGAPPPIPAPPPLIDNNSNDGTKKHNDDDSSISNSVAAENRHLAYYHHPFHNPAAIALTIVCVLVILVVICWLIRYCRRRAIWPFGSIFVAGSDYDKEGRRRHRGKKRASRQIQATSSIASSVPSSAPPSFSSTPPDMAIIRHPHLRLYNHRNQQPSIHSGRSSTGSVEPLPSYLSPYPSPPKYEQAIVCQIRGGLRGEEDTGGSSTMLNDHYTAASLPSMWVPVYFTAPQQQQQNFRRGVNGGELFGFTPNHSYWLQQFAPNHQGGQLQQQQQQQQEESSNAHMNSNNDSNNSNQQVSAVTLLDSSISENNEQQQRPAS